MLSLQQLLDSDFRNLRIVDLENRIRDNKRIIVNLMSENIFNLRFGHAHSQEHQHRLDREELIIRMINARQKRIRIVERLFEVANAHRYQLSTWGLHADLFDMRKLVRPLNDIVILLQEKNLIAQMSGKKIYIEVGEIERQLDWPLRIV